MAINSTQALRVPDFGWYLSAKTCFTLAVNMQAMVVAWQVYDLTRSPLSLGFIGLAEVIPFVLTTLWGGHLADRFDRRGIVMVAALGYVTAAAALCYISSQATALLTLGRGSVIFGLIALTGAARGFFSPAQTALLGQIVPRNLYANAATWSGITWYIGAIGGPAIGGLLYAPLGAATLYGIASALGLLTVLLFARIRSRSQLPPVTEGVMERIGAGVRFVFGHKVLLGALTLDMFSVLFGGAVALLPMFADQILHAGPEALGWLRVAPSVGAILASTVMTRFPPLRAAGYTLLIAVALFGMATIAFALSKNLYLSMVLLAFTGMFDDVSVVIRSTILQVYTPDEMRGRVSAVNSIFVSSSNELGAFESGTMAWLMGLVPSVVLGGSMTLLVVALVAILNPSLRQLDLRFIRNSATSDY